MPAYGGVYEIVNRADGKRYIGSAVSFQGRWAQHRRQLRHGSHHSPHLQRAWDKYGEESFDFHPAMLCTRVDLLDWEQRYLDEFKPEYNVALCVTAPMLGRKASPLTLHRMRAAHKGRPGRKWTAEERIRWSAQRRGRPGHSQSTAARAKLSAAHLGKRHPPEVLAKLRAAKLGTKRGPHSAETRAKMALAARGRRHSEETRKKIGDVQRGRILLSAHRAAISAGLQAAYVEGRR